MLMVIKNGATLSKDYFKSYLKLRMNTQGYSLDEAHEQTYQEFFGENQNRFGKSTYQHFLDAFKEMKQK